jgi:hypothetical protein
MSSDKYLFAIYTCVKNQQKAEFLYRILQNRLPANVDIALFFGKSDVKTKCNFVLLNCEDDYDNLSFKTLCLLRYVYDNNYTGVLKCDDDIFPNLQMLREFIQMPNKGDYMGNVVTIKNEYLSVSHIGKSKNVKTPLKIPECSYCTGPLYYLSNRAITTIINKDIIGFISEDVMIGVNMTKNGIVPTHYHLYKSEPFAIDKSCVENINNRDKYLFVYLQGGLGNQLFQLAAAYGTALLRGMFPIIVLSSNSNTYVHGIDPYLDTLYRNFIYLKGVQFNNMNIWAENEMTGANCFKYCRRIQMQFNAEKDLLMQGYFQTENYFLHSKVDFIDKIIDKSTLDKTLHMYPKAKNSYFIHVRRGDYVGNALYAINYDAYLVNALEFIYNKDATEKHFYVLSNDPAYCKTQAIFTNKDGITFTIMDEMSTLDTLYLMACCGKGAICANSSFSWWGSYLNSNPDKIVCFPDKWMTNMPFTANLDICYQGSNIISTSAKTV